MVRIYDYSILVYQCIWIRYLCPRCYSVIRNKKIELKSNDMFFKDLHNYLSNDKIILYIKTEE